MNAKNAIVDAEVRVVHPEARDPRLAEERGEPAWRDVYQHPNIKKAVRLWSIEATLESMDKCGVDHAILSGLAWNDPHILRENNDYVRQCLLSYPRRFKGLYTPDTSAPENAAAEIMELDPGLYVGVELIPKWQNTHIDSPELEPIYQAVSTKQFFLKAYTAHPTQTLDGDTPFRTLGFLRKHPEIRTLIPHLGGLLCLYALHTPIRRLLQNAYFITSVSSTMKMVEFAAAVNPDNLLFGTDFPFNHCFDQATPLEAMNALALDQGIIDRILGKNALSLFDFCG